MSSRLPASGSDWARFTPGATPDVTLMKAHFTEHVFERHSHDAYAIGVTLSGVQAFHCRGQLFANTAGDLLLFNPDEAHDGQRGSDEGFSYAMLYIDVLPLRQRLDADAGTRAGAYFRQPSAHDPAATAAFRRIIDAIGQAQESLRAEELTSDFLVRLLQRHGEWSPPAHLRDPGFARLSRVRDYIRTHFAQDIGVDDLAQQVGVSRVHLSRAFAQRFGAPPHVYLNSVRLYHARRALLSGLSLAQAAADAGFVDQSHFTRRFKGAFGITPGRWLEQMRGATSGRQYQARD